MRLIFMCILFCCAVDCFGRRPLLIEAGFQMLIAEIAIAVILALGFQEGNLSSGLAVAVIVLICVFISAFAWSWGEAAYDLIILFH